MTLDIDSISSLLSMQVIRGWDLSILGSGEDLPPMREGGKRRILVPPQLGWGKDGKVRASWVYSLFHPACLVQ